MDRINSLENEIAEIRRTLHEKEKELYTLRKQWIPVPQINGQSEVEYDGQHIMTINGKVQCDRLPKWAIERYSRQILLPDIGVAGQERLCIAKVLVVGAGGLGCPAAMYLAGAGVGEIGIVDYDTVDLTNIHRQVLHSEADQHMNKVDSAVNTLRGINSRITITPYNVQLDSSNALEIASNYDVILDCTDNVPTRYMLNDVCVLSQLPLISGSALKMEGQITIYGYKAEDTTSEDGRYYTGPCYRCVFPSPPPAEAVGSCSANGVAGPVPGIIGAMQALEAIKYLVGQSRDKLLVERMVLFDGEDMTFRTVKLRPQNADCAACSKTPTITQLLDYETFCRAQAKEKKKQDARIKSQRRKEEKVRRMTGQSYFGFRVAKPEGKRKWVQDVPKSERKIGPPCKSEFCSKGTSRACSKIDENDRQDMFKHFWYELDWKGKRKYVRTLVDTVPPKRRRLKHKGEISRKGDTKQYHLISEEKRLPVCRVMFLNTLGIKEAMVRCWLTKEDIPKTPKVPKKTLNVVAYIDDLPKMPPKCQYCRNTGIEYINLDNIKNLFQLYNQYLKDMKIRGVNPASRKTFSNAFSMRNIRFFKPKNGTDICDLVGQHNMLPSLSVYNEAELVLERDSDSLVPTNDHVEVMTVNYYYTNEW